MAQTLTPGAPSSAPDAPPSSVAHSRWISAAALLAAAALIVITSRWGEALLADGVRMKIHTPPLRGPTQWRPGMTMIPATLVAVGSVLWLPLVIPRLRWRWMVLAAGGVAIVWAVALALVDGSEALTKPLIHGQYLRTVPRVSNLGDFLGTFVDRLPTYNIHTQGHPPGMVVVLWLMDRSGLGGVNANAGLVFASGGAAVAAALVALREVAGEVMARRAAPFLALTPAAIWWSSGDVFFSAVGASAVMVLILATGRIGRRADGLAALGGVLFAATAYLSYGLVLLAIIPIAIAVHRRRFRPLVVAAVLSFAVMLAVTALSGFSWWEGLAATRDRYFIGVARNRPYEFFLFANLAGFALALGPATVVAFTRLRHRPLAWLVGAAVTAVLLADVSGMSKAEVERIWLPFVPWVVVGTAAVTATLRATRGWLSAQVGLALLIAVAVRSPW